MEEHFKISGKVVVYEDADRICLARRRNRYQVLRNTKRTSRFYKTRELADKLRDN
jgi:hypothetical protein